MISYQKTYVVVPQCEEGCSSFSVDNTDGAGRKRIEHRHFSVTKATGRAVLYITSLLLLLLFAYGKYQGSYPPLHSNMPMLGESQSSMDTTSIEDGMNTPRFYNDQLVDHFNTKDKRKWSNRYYKSTKFFNGPGHPILLVVGGEGGLNHGMLYPFVTEVLASKFGAAVLQIEHRFYGPHWPLSNPTNTELLQLLTPHQAMADMVRLTKHVRDTELVGCAPSTSSSSYCPVISIGGSYPGFLSAMFRFVYPDFVDIAYASAAPLLMYGQASRQSIYYDIVTDAAERLSPGCSHSVRSTLEDALVSIDKSITLKEAAKSVGVCTHDLPNENIATKDDLKQSIIQLVAFAFASYNSDAYPPGTDTETYKACKFFQDSSLDTVETISSFFQKKIENELREEMGCDLAWVNCDDVGVHLDQDDDASPECVDLSEGEDKPDEDGSNDGKMWNFQTCTNVIFLAGYSNNSLLPPMEASYEDLTRGCQQEFGMDITPRPFELVDKWNFVNGIQDQKYILFTNGMQDMWMGGSITWNVSDTVLALNFKNGAHHSDLSHQGPTESDTPDIKEGFVQIEMILKGWLEDIRGG